MALKDWKKITGGWQNKKVSAEKISIELQEWDREEKSYYIIEVVENGKTRQYDNAFTSRGEALRSVKSYMRTH